MLDWIVEEEAMSIADRRALLIALTSVPLIFLTSCDTEPKPSATATLFNADEVHEAMKFLLAVVNDLQNDVGQFDLENWRDVVPNVRVATAEVASAVAKLRKALGYSDSN
jgi:hypothetical protein